MGSGVKVAVGKRDRRMKSLSFPSPYGEPGNGALCMTNLPVSCLFIGQVVKSEHAFVQS